jgi:hypothetical protein
MTDELHLPRFVVRRGARRDWMVLTDILRDRLCIRGIRLSDYPKTMRGQLKTC